MAGDRCDPLPRAEAIRARLDAVTSQLDPTPAWTDPFFGGDKLGTRDRRRFAEREEA